MSSFPLQPPPNAQRRQLIADWLSHRMLHSIPPPPPPRGRPATRRQRRSAWVPKWTFSLGSRTQGACHAAPTLAGILLNGLRATRRAFSTTPAARATLISLCSLSSIQTCSSGC